MVPVELRRGQVSRAIFENRLCLTLTLVKDGYIPPPSQQDTSTRGPGTKYMTKYILNYVERIRVGWKSDKSVVSPHCQARHMDLYDFKLELR